MQTIINGITVDTTHVKKLDKGNMVVPNQPLILLGAGVNTAYLMNSGVMQNPEAPAELDPVTNSTILRPGYSISLTLCFDPKNTTVNLRAGSQLAINNLQVLKDMLMLAIANDPEIAKVYKANQELAKKNPLLAFKSIQTGFGTIAELRQQSDSGDPLLKAGESSSLVGRKTNRETGERVPPCQAFLDAGAKESDVMIMLKTNVFGRTSGSFKSIAAQRLDKATAEYLAICGELKKSNPGLLENQTHLDVLALEICHKYAFKKSATDKDAALHLRYSTTQGSPYVTNPADLNANGGYLTNGQQVLVKVKGAMAYNYMGKIGVGFSLEAITLSNKQILNLPTAGASFDEALVDLAVDASTEVSINSIEL